eukprot:TRINITY_DN22287_c0_g2_i1.p1 TRINITY_DN22287_c0_g2~~TRINITY_DN22287_c0_g2_i1.p1  ORF type:complete len:102 (-),score=10.22 TRINITY_DN22287_c0_g2_i1:256-561(-)
MDHGADSARKEGRRRCVRKRARRESSPSSSSSGREERGRAMLAAHMAHMQHMAHQFMMPPHMYGPAGAAPHSSWPHVLRPRQHPCPRESKHLLLPLPQSPA